ncbi:hypothetical protein [Sphingomonas sp. PAMC 26617]|uniref:hypothetical protein n=1 Tax=Sphingomonas sp. PAMC 26617 TaxID=1112216 RepID=UPI000288A3D3|nr:hypothetical protein [Sphingomonas sp. PAMC 26617]
MPRAAGSLVFALLAVLPAPAPAAEGGAASVVPVAELRVPILDAGRFAGTLRVQSALDYADPADGKAATERAPELRAAALAAGLDFARLHVSALAPIDAALLSETLTRAARSVDPHVRRVLILDVSARQP